MYRCCTFDLDGTLTNTICALAYTIDLTLKEYGLGSIEDEQAKVFVGDGYQKSVERALCYCGDVELVHREDVPMTYDAPFEGYYLYRIETYNGMKGLLDALRAKGIKTAVVTNKLHDRATEDVETVFGKDCFDGITGE